MKFHGLISMLLVFLFTFVPGITLVVRVKRVPTQEEIDKAAVAERALRDAIAEYPVKPEDVGFAKEVRRYTSEPRLLRVDENGKKYWTITKNLGGLRDSDIAIDVDSILDVDGRILFDCDKQYYRINRFSVDCKKHSSEDHPDEKHVAKIYLDEGVAKFKSTSEFIQDRNCWITITYKAKDQKTAYWLKGDLQDPNDAYWLEGR